MAGFTNSKDALEQFKTQLERQNREARLEAMAAARAFANACQSGDYKETIQAMKLLDGIYSNDVWRLAMLKASRLSHVNDEVREAFLHYWVMSKSIPQNVRHRPILAKAIRVLLPRSACTSAVQIFRGCSRVERRKRLYGFSWTTSLEVATGFRDDPRHQGDGIVLRTIAPPEAILLDRDKRNDVIVIGDQSFDEHEVIVDPYRLDKISVM
jgi:hypothetical protein